MNLPSFAPISEPNNLGDLLKYEAPNLYSREQLTVANGQMLLLGAVIGISGATGKAQAVDPSATDGAQFAAGVLMQNVDASGGERSDAIAAVRHAVVADHALVWSAGITTDEKITAVQQLKALGVLVRKAI